MKSGKLVRDKIPLIMKKRGKNAKFHIAAKNEYWKKLKEKLLEETGEFLENAVLEEYIDILEVMEAIAKEKGWKAGRISKAKTAKSAKRGKFRKRIILE